MAKDLQVTKNPRASDLVRGESEVSLVNAWSTVECRSKHFESRRRTSKRSRGSQN